MYRESHLRSILKAVSWRVSGTLATAIIVLLATGKWTVALFVGVLEFVSKIGIFFVHERIWDRITFGKKAPTPKVIWLTGFSGSGKSTIAEKLYLEMKRRNFKVEKLDGDTIRDLFPSTGFSENDRNEHIKRVGYLASTLEKNGIFVVCSFISPFESSRNFVRSLCRNFVEVYVSTPLSVCEERDVKGLYAKARRGEIKNFTGIDSPYETPKNPELKIDTSQVSLENAVQQVLGKL